MYAHESFVGNIRPSVAGPSLAELTRVKQLPSIRVALLCTFMLGLQPIANEVSELNAQQVAAGTSDVRVVVDFISPVAIAFGLDSITLSTMTSATLRSAGLNVSMDSTANVWKVSVRVTPSVDGSSSALSLQLSFLKNAFAVDSQNFAVTTSTPSVKILAYHAIQEQVEVLLKRQVPVLLERIQAP